MFSIPAVARFKSAALAAAIASLSWSTSATAQDDLRLPDIGNSAGSVVAEHEEREYGEALMREFHRRAQTVDDPVLAEYISHLGYQLVSHSNDPGRDFTFFLVDSGVVNAFAAPGGYIGIHSQLMLEAETEAELAGVMAHEVAHVTQRHIARRIEAQARMSLPMTLLMIGAIAAGAAAGSGDAVQAGVIGTQAAAAQMQINFTRHNEHEADRIGIQTLAKAGFDPIGMADFFGRMQRISRNYGKAPTEFLRTHPIEATRIAEAKDRARKLDHQPSDDYDADAFQFMRERARVLTEDRLEDLLPYYRDQIEHHPQRAALHYGLALAHSRLDDPVAATERLRALKEVDQQRFIVNLLQAEVNFQSAPSHGNTEQFGALLKRYPGNRAVTKSWADALVERGRSGDAKQAERLLRPLAQRHANDASLQLSYARAADLAGFPVRAGEAFAQQMYLHGRLYDAVSQLENLVEYSKLDYYQRARIEARLEELVPMLEELEEEGGWDPSEGREHRRRRLTSLYH